MKQDLRTRIFSLRNKIKRAQFLIDTYTKESEKYYPHIKDTQKQATEQFRSRVINYFIDNHPTDNNMAAVRAEDGVRGLRAMLQGGADADHDSYNTFMYSDTVIGHVQYLLEDLSKNRKKDERLAELIKEADTLRQLRQYNFEFTEAVELWNSEYIQPFQQAVFEMQTALDKLEEQK